MDHQMNSDMGEFFDFGAFLNSPAEEEPQSQGAGDLRLPPLDAGSSVYANELDFEPQDLDLDFDSFYEATLPDRANSHVQQTSMDAPEGLLLGSMDESGGAATPGYPNVVTSTSPSASQPTALPYHDATSYSPPSTDSIGEAALQQTQIGALSNSDTTPQASNVLVCKVPEVGCTCFCCKHRIVVDRKSISFWHDRRFGQSFNLHQDFLSRHDMLKFASSLWQFRWILIDACSAQDCDRPHGIYRQAETEHLFSPQLCSDQVQYRCAVQGCQFFSTRRSDLKRHHAVKHCTQPKRFPCLEPFCKYGGDNGFKRLDKLKDHQRKIHEGKPKLGQALRTIKSAATKPVTELV